MKSKITYQLIGYFSAVLFMFAFIIGGLFLFLFSRYTIEVNRENLQDRAVRIAEQLSEFEQDQTQPRRGHRQRHGYGAYLNFLDDIAMSEVWIVDESAKTIDMSHPHHGVTYDQFTKEAGQLIEQVFGGSSAFSEEFSIFFPEKTITVGAPVYRSDGSVSAAVLLHADVAGMGKGIRQGITFLLTATFIAFMLSVILSAVLAMRFVNPLKKMTDTTQHLMAGDYQHRNDIERQDEIGFLAQSMDEMAAKLQMIDQERKNLDQMRQQFITSVSHELRTPVTVLRGSLELLCDGIITDEQQKKDYLFQMLKDSIHMQRLINDLLELSKLQNADFAIEMSELDLMEVLEDAARSVRGIAKEKEIRLVVQRLDHPFMIWGDYGRMRQLFLILLDNAIKFSGEGSSVEIEVKAVKGQCIIKIKDFGCGITEEEIEHIFERFYHVKSNHNKAGSGLGLAIAREIAGRHQIDLTCESKREEYTTMIISCPGKELEISV